MKNNKLLLALTFLIPFTAEATIRFDSQQFALASTTMHQEFVPPSPRKKIPLPKTPAELSSELCRQLLRGKVNVGKLFDHRFFKLNEESLENQVKSLDAQLYENPFDIILNKQLKAALKDLKQARDLRHNLNGDWEKIKKGVRMKKRPRHQRDIQGSLFESPLRRESPIEKINSTKHHRSFANFIG